MSANLWDGHRVILHADMDAFYASIEQRDRPELRGRPVIVGGPRESRGVVSAASYEARAFGVKSAMPLRVAAELCPHAVFVSGRMDYYAETSARIFAIFERYTPLVEPLSLDEAFLDVTGCERRFGPPREIAEHVRAAVKSEERLTVSVGVAASKAVAKIASDLQKPDGLTVVRPGTEARLLSPLPVRHVWGVGPRTAERLARRGIHTIGDLLRHDPQRLHDAWGLGVSRAAQLVRGDDDRSVAPERTRKSVGNETTFQTDIADFRLADRYLQQLADHVARRLRAKDLQGRTVSLKLRFADFRTITRQSTLSFPVNSAQPIYSAASRMFHQEIRPGERIRLVGIHVSGFGPDGARQLPLVAADVPRMNRLDGALDRVRDRFGDAAVVAGSLLDSEARMSDGRYRWRDAVLG